MMDKLPVVYIRGYGGPTAGINSVVEDPFYGFNSGSTHIRVGRDGDPAFYQFEGPLLRLPIEEAATDNWTIVAVDSQLWVVGPRSAARIRLD